MNVVFIAHYFAVQEAYLQADMDGTTYHFLPPQKLKPPTPADVAAQSHFVVVLLSGCLTGFPGAADDGRGGGAPKCHKSMWMESRTAPGTMESRTAPTSSCAMTVEHLEVDMVLVGAGCCRGRIFLGGVLLKIAGLVWEAACWWGEHS